MSKQITVTSKIWKGSVTIADPLTIPQAKLIEAGMKHPDEADAVNGRVWLTLIDEMQLPAVLGCVEKWELENMPEKLTADNFPASPRGESHTLINEIFTSIMQVYLGEEIVPNA